MELLDKQGNLLLSKEEAEKIIVLAKSALASVSITWRKIETFKTQLEKVTGKQNAV